MAREKEMLTNSTHRTQAFKHKILIVDDHPIVRQGLARLLGQESDIEVCEGADNVAEAFEQVKALTPSLVVVDIALKDSLGIELISHIKAYNENIKTLAWSMFDESIYAERALRAGAMGYVSKEETIETVIGAIRKILQDEVYLSDRMTSRILQRLGSGKPVDEDPVASLSNRELEVFQMIGQGLTTRQIARRLEVKPKTVESHREKIKMKLNLRNATELNCRAVQWILENG